MSRPFKHPKNGTYYFRKAVPEGLRPVLGKREEKISLRTKDPVAAKVEYAKVAAEVALKWKALLSKPEPLSQRQIIALAGLVYLDMVDSLSDEPGPSEAWEHVIRLQQEARAGEVLDTWMGSTVDGLLQRQGIRPDALSRSRLIDEVDRAITQAAGHLKRNAEGDYRPDPDATRFPVLAPSHEAPKPRVGTWTLTGLVEDWWREAKATGLKPATYESYRNTMTKFVKFLGHDDAGLVTDKDVVGFKDHRLAEINPRTGTPVSAKTVKDSDLAGLKSIFGWAVTNRRLTTNPVTGITIKLGKPQRLRSKGFTNAEAKAILSAAWKHQQGLERPKTAAAKRWVHWLCAYSGARVGEIAQLRKEDVKKEDGFWVVTISPEAGTVKTNIARKVVLHPQLVELGFPAFVTASANGPLFLTPAEDGTVLGPLKGIKNRLQELSRTVVSDKNVAPCHGWRHRFKTVGREAGIDPHYLDTIQGHAPRTDGASYGDLTVTTQAREIARLPHYEIE